MITFITGKPGGGKGLVALKEIIDYLVNSDGAVVTNLALKCAPWVRRTSKRGKRSMVGEVGLSAYLHSKYGKDFDCDKRVFILPEETMGSFYLYRVEFVRDAEGAVLSSKLIKAQVITDEKGKVDSYETGPALANGGILYCVDEAWKFYGARSWQDTGKGVLFYGAQHRKLNDRLLIVCQNTKQVDTALRMVAEDFWVCCNHGKKKLGFFRQPEMFSVSQFDQVPSGSSIDPMCRNMFKLDKKGLGGCYDTAAGVGVAGGMGADIGEKAKGLPFWVIFVALVFMGLGIWGACKGAGVLTGKLLTGTMNKPKAVTNDVVKAAGGGVFGLSPGVQARLAVAVPPLPEPEPVWLVGRCMLPDRRFRVMLSDGSSYTTGDGMLTFLHVEYAVVDGVKIFWKSGLEEISKRRRAGSKSGNHEGVVGRGFHPDQVGAFTQTGAAGAGSGSSMLGF